MTPLVFYVTTSPNTREAALIVDAQAATFLAMVEIFL